MKDHTIIQKYKENTNTFRTIRSFVSRKRRFTKEQQYIFDQYWPEIGIKFSMDQLDMAKVFNQHQPIVLEVGFGTGSSLVTMAQNYPYYNFLGIEVYTPGVGKCINLAKKAEIKNLKIVHHDAVEVIRHMIADDSLASIQLLFPDPWQKARHRKRRIIQTPFAELMLKKIQLGGTCYISTDWEEYAFHILQIMNNIEGYRLLSNHQKYTLVSRGHLLTKFEQRGKDLGHEIRNLVFKKVKGCQLS
jgi:tRNA (guanine-N7-)-methyltransferase